MKELTLTMTQGQLKALKKSLEYSSDKLFQITDYAETASDAGIKIVTVQYRDEEDLFHAAFYAGAKVPGMIDKGEY